MKFIRVMFFVLLMLLQTSLLSMEEKIEKEDKQKDRVPTLFLLAQNKIKNLINQTVNEVSMDDIDDTVSYLNDINNAGLSVWVSLVVEKRNDPKQIPRVILGRVVLSAIQNSASEEKINNIQSCIKKYGNQLGAKTVRSLLAALKKHISDIVANNKGNRNKIFETITNIKESVQVLPEKIKKPMIYYANSQEASLFWGVAYKNNMNDIDDYMKLHHKNFTLKEDKRFLDSALKLGHNCIINDSYIDTVECVKKILTGSYSNELGEKIWRKGNKVILKLVMNAIDNSCCNPLPPVMKYYIKNYCKLLQQDDSKKLCNTLVLHMKFFNERGCNKNSYKRYMEIIKKTIKYSNCFKQKQKSTLLTKASSQMFKLTKQLLTGNWSNERYRGDYQVTNISKENLSDIQEYMKIYFDSLSDSKKKSFYCTLIDFIKAIEKIPVFHIQNDIENIKIIKGIAEDFPQKLRDKLNDAADSAINNIILSIAKNTNNVQVITQLENDYGLFLYEANKQELSKLKKGFEWHESVRGKFKRSFLYPTRHIVIPSIEFTAGIACGMFNAVLFSASMIMGLYGQQIFGVPSGMSILSAGLMSCFILRYAGSPLLRIAAHSAQKTIPTYNPYYSLSTNLSLRFMHKIVNVGYPDRMSTLYSTFTEQFECCKCKKQEPAWGTKKLLYGVGLPEVALHRYTYYTGMSVGMLAGALAGFKAYSYVTK